MLGDVKYLRQISDVHSMSSITDEHCAHLEIQLGDKKIEFCTKTQKIIVRLRCLSHSQTSVIFILSKLFDLYLKKSIPLKNIDIAAIREQGTLDNADSLCILFGVPTTRTRAVLNDNAFYVVFGIINRRWIQI